MKETRDRKKSVFLFVRIGVVTAGIIWGIYWLSGGQRWIELVNVFKKMKVFSFVLALAVFTLCQAAIGFRWWILLRMQGVKISIWMAVKLTFLGLFYNNFLPSSVGGDFVRAWYVTRHTDRQFAAALSVFVDRAVGLFGTFLIAVFFYFLYLRGRGIVQPAEAKSGAGFFSFFVEYRYWFYAAGAIAAAAVLVISLNSKGRVKLRNLIIVIRGWVEKIWRKTLDAAVLYCRRPGLLLIVLVMTIVIQIATITGFWFLGVDLGVDVSISYYYVIFALSWVVGILPVSIAGAVVVEGSLALMFVHLAGVGMESALALALCQRIIWMVSSLPGGLIHLSGMHLPKDFSVDE
jgi:uncharacterized protein (TIRG00374 family)